MIPPGCRSIVGIALGLGIVGSAELSAAGLLSVFGPRHYVAADALRLAAFDRPPEF